MTTSEDDDDLGIKEGSQIESSHTKYTVVKMLGEGGFGAVYLVHNSTDPNLKYALKVEKKLETRRDSKLKMEIAILKMVSNERADKSHFTKIIDRGKKERYFFLVMQLVGKSLADLKAVRPHKVFTISTGIGASMQCLEAVEDLHKHGFIHRDLKPANYAVGLGDQIRVVYILDFGIARRILNDKGEIKTPRVSVAFKGTVKFAAIACHKRMELGPKDDCESWFYLLLDLLLKNGLPWKKISDKNDVLVNKEECRTVHRDKLFQGLKCKDEFGKIIDYIDSLHYEDRVDYSFVYEMLKTAANVCEANLTDPYDWEEPSTSHTCRSSKSRSSKSPKFG
ncbi:Tau-tubulin kinase 2 [Toxocara canis]|uniref:Tau-tubulin kinase 2 n=1 Tax=Toxocara canis TaxID=6265 RepID=A0A0B2W278_TOXCA|nr:Tau-tubulin kinase 2 [Toxocara canis]